jgi:8-oxo-dGTP pyrophosphatase MutT (NUDIX family)
MASAGKYVPPHLRNRPAAAIVPEPEPAARADARAAGVVIFRRAESSLEPEYLLVQSATGGRCWTPPKGILEPRESELDGARRETLEETALRETSDYVLASPEPVFRTSYWDAKNKRNKTSVYFLGELVVGAVVTLQAGEIAACTWLAAGPAKRLMGYPEMEQLIDAAEMLLGQR